MQRFSMQPQTQKGMLMYIQRDIHVMEFKNECVSKLSNPKLFYIPIQNNLHQDWRQVSVTNEVEVVEDKKRKRKIYHDDDGNDKDKDDEDKHDDKRQYGDPPRKYVIHDMAPIWTCPNAYNHESRCSHAVCDSCKRKYEEKTTAGSGEQQLNQVGRRTSRSRQNRKPINCDTCNLDLNIFVDAGYFTEKYLLENDDVPKYCDGCSAQFVSSTNVVCL